MRMCVFFFRIKEKTKKKDFEQKKNPMSIPWCCVCCDDAVGRLVLCTSIQMPLSPNPLQPIVAGARQLPQAATCHIVASFQPAHHEPLGDVANHPAACSPDLHLATHHGMNTESWRLSHHLPRHRHHHHHPLFLFLHLRLVTNRGIRHQHLGSRLAVDHRDQHRQN